MEAQEALDMRELVTGVQLSIYFLLYIYLESSFWRVRKYVNSLKIGVYVKINSPSA